MTRPQLVRATRDIYNVLAADKENEAKFGPVAALYVSPQAFRTLWYDLDSEPFARIDVVETQALAQVADGFGFRFYRQWHVDEGARQTAERERMAAQ